MQGLNKNIKMFGLFLLILSVAISSLYHIDRPCKESSQKEISSKKKNDRQEKIDVAGNIVAVIPFIEFDLVKDLYLIVKFEFAVKKIIHVFDSGRPYTMKYFRTLFCFVISPNAP